MAAAAVLDRAYRLSSLFRTGKYPAERKTWQ